MRTWTITAALAALLLSATAVSAQTSLGTPGARECPPDVSPAPPSSETTGSPSLSEQLSHSKGIICPPAGIDPGLTERPPGGGRTPVIPPPGTAGGDPNIVPK